MLGNCCQEKIILGCLWKSLEIGKDKSALNTPIGKEGSGLRQETSSYLLTVPRTNIKGTLMAEPSDFIFMPFLSIGTKHGTNTNAINLLTLPESRFRNKFGMTHFFLSC